jgi:hypothetical protein
LWFWLPTQPPTAIASPSAVIVPVKRASGRPTSAFARGSRAP